MDTKNLLIVDDSATMRMLISMTIKKSMPWVSVTEAVNGVDALSVMGKKDFDMVLTDMQMPEMDGAQLITAIRSSLNKTLPVIVITTRGEETDRNYGLSLGADGYITKPINGHELKETIIHFLEMTEA